MYYQLVVFLYFIFFVLGSAVGSFLNVVIDRIPAGGSILGRSHCDHCGRTLSTFELVPIVSFFIVGRRCRICRKPISWQYPIIEVTTGLVFTVAFGKFVTLGNLGFVPLFYALFVLSTLIVVSAVDFKFSLVPTSLVFLASLISLFFNYFLRSSADFVGFTVAAFLLAAFFWGLVFLTKGKGMGEGDIVLGFLIGMVLGARDGILAVFLAFLTGAAVAIFLMFAGKRRFGQTIPFAPFLALGFLISFLFANQIINYYLMIY